MPQVVILAAGLGTRLGKPFPKPLTPLRSGESILHRQLRLLRTAFGAQTPITVVVGFKLDLVVESIPDVLFAYNELFDQTNTSKSLHKALRLSQPGGVLWLNGDVVFEPGLLEEARPYLDADQSFVCVNTSSVAEEEVKYRLDTDGYISELSKQVRDGLGEAVGVNFVSSADKAALVTRLDECGDQDYFERGIEQTVLLDRMRWPVVDISQHACVEVDFADDLQRANALDLGSPVA